VRKLAILVEGKTEHIFVETLLQEIAEENKIAIEITSVNANQSGRDIYSVKKPLIICVTKSYVLI
jgi:hypothetical protein